MTSYQAAQQAARDNRDANRGEATGQAMPERTGSYAAASEQAKANRQPRVDQSNQVKTMLASLRKQESGSYEGDYTAQGQWIEAQSDKSMGAYGIMSKNWAGYTSAAGIPNANWRDSRSQDRVAGQMVNRLANQFGGNMGLVAAAWFSGAGMANRVVEKYGYKASVTQIGEVLGATIGDYASQVVGHGGGISTTPYGIENNLSDFTSDVGFMTPQNRGQRQEPNSAKDAVRARLVAMAGMGRTEIQPTDEARRPGQMPVADEATQEAGRQRSEHFNDSFENPPTSSDWENMSYEERGNLLDEYSGILDNNGLLP